jgi:hypothetical protein
MGYPVPALTTNEVRNAAGTEVEFQKISSNLRSVEWAQIAETPNLPHRLKISHEEIGSGLNRRRRSVTRIDKTVAGAVAGTYVTVTCYEVIDIPIGNLSSLSEPANVHAELGSFCHTDGTASVFIYGGTATGALAMLNGAIA